MNDFTAFQAFELGKKQVEKTTGGTYCGGLRTALDRDLDTDGTERIKRRHRIQRICATPISICDKEICGEIVAVEPVERESLDGFTF